MRHEIDCNCGETCEYQEGQTRTATVSLDSVSSLIQFAKNAEVCMLNIARLRIMQYYLVRGDLFDF